MTLPAVPCTARPARCCSPNERSVCILATTLCPLKSEARESDGRTWARSEVWNVSICSRSFRLQVNHLVAHSNISGSLSRSACCPGWEETLDLIQVRKLEAFWKFRLNYRCVWEMLGTWPKEIPARWTGIWRWGTYLFVHWP